MIKIRINNYRKQMKIKNKIRKSKIIMIENILYL